jgi:hypothetical protein
MRITGLQGLLEGKSAGDILVHQVGGGLIHPWAGPMVDAAITAITGQNTSGYQEAPHAKRGEDQRLLNIKAALERLNPALGGILEAKQRGAGGVGEAAWEYLKGFGRAVGVGETKPPAHRR